MSDQERNIYQSIADEIANNKELSEADKQIVLQNLARHQQQKLNLMITGATGCGKSSTINALFDTNTAKVGVGVDPETQEITSYRMGNLILWDTPGLGDGKEADARHRKNIINKLMEKDSEGHALIDLVLVVLDGSTRDLGTSYALINEVIIPTLKASSGNNSDDFKKRILVAINQCDLAMKGLGWDKDNNCPQPELTRFLEEKVASVRKRIFEGTGVDIEPIYYSAGWTDGMTKQHPYNLSKLLYFIISYTPEEKRAIYIDHISEEDDNFLHDDGRLDYNKKSQNLLVESIKHGAEVGGKIGGVVFGKPGEFAGKVIGGIVGGAVKILGDIFSHRSSGKRRRW